jgi:hypothetical protein
MEQIDGMIYLVEDDTLALSRLTGVDGTEFG